MLRLASHSHGSYVSRSHEAMYNLGPGFETMTGQSRSKFRRDAEKRTASAAQTWFLIDQTESTYSAIT